MSTSIESKHIVRGYYDAWTAGDVDAAVAHLAQGFTSWGSGNMHSPSAAAFTDSLRHFRQGVARVDLISELYGDDEATLVYDVHVQDVGAVRTAEHFRLSGGRIASNILIFDEWPYQAAKK
jgi:ketosteroid isomerase-like protein